MKESESEIGRDASSGARRLVLAAALAGLPVAYAGAIFLYKVYVSQSSSGAFTIAFACVWLMALVAVGRVWRVRRAVCCYAIAAPVVITLVLGWLWGVRTGRPNFSADETAGWLAVVLLMPLEAASLLYVGGALAAWLWGRGRRGRGTRKAKVAE